MARTKSASLPSAARAMRRCAAPACPSPPPSMASATGRLRVRRRARATLTDDYIAGTYSGIDLVFRASSRLLQRPIVDRLLPVEPSGDADEGIPGRQFIFEPSPDAVLRQLLPRYVATRVYQAVLELTGERASARMVAMKNATENAQELIEDLTLTYNKVRQANITREMIEIATGASASERPRRFHQAMAVAHRRPDDDRHHRTRRRHRVPAGPAAGDLQRGRDPAPGRAAGVRGPAAPGNNWVRTWP